MKKKMIYLISSASALLATPAMALSVVYSSIPNLNATPTQLGYCSSCFTNSFQYLDPFTLTSDASIQGFNLSTYVNGQYLTSNPLVFQVWNSTHTSILFSSSSVTPTYLGVADGASTTQLVTGSFAAINLSAGNYYASFVGSNVAVNGYAGGNGGGGQLLTVGNGATFEARNDNIGYQLLGTSAVSSVPEPSTWAMMFLGLTVVGYAMRRRSNVTTTVRYA